MTATQTPLTPITEWSESDQHETIDRYRTPRTVAGNVAWEILTHAQSTGLDIARVHKLPVPDGFDAEDMWSFLFDLVTEAGEIGYAVAQINTAALDLPDQIRPAQIARAVAALMRIATVETDEAFDVDYLAKREAAWLAKMDSAA